MSNEIKGKESKPSFFTIEYFGVTLVITAFLLLVCLIFGEQILFELGAEIKYFLLGVAGIFAFPLLIALAVVGIFLLFGIKPSKKKRSKRLNAVICTVIFFGMLMTTIFNSKEPTTMGEYLKYAYDSARTESFNSVMGGALFSIATYFPVKYLTYIGAICLFGFLTITSLYLIFAPNKKGQKESQNERDSESEQIAPQPIQANVNAQPNYEQPIQQSQPNSPYSVNEAMQKLYPQNFANGGQTNSNPVIIDNNNGYVTMSKEDAMRILYGNNRGYAEQYNDMFMGRQPRTFEEFTSELPKRDGASVSEPINKQFNYEFSDKSNENNSYDDEFTYEEDLNGENNVLDDYGETEKSSERVSTRAFFEKLNESRTKIGEQKEEKEEVSDEQEFDYEIGEADLENVEFIYEEDENEPTFESDNEQYNEQDDFNNDYAEEDQDGEFDENSFDEPSNDEPSNDEPSFDKCMIIENMPLNYRYKAPSATLLPTIEKSTNDFEYEVFKAEVKQRILSTLETFGVKTQIAKVSRGPAVSRFDIEIPHDCPMSKVTKLQSDINLRIAAKSPIRMIAPVPNTSYVGIEVENKSRETVGLKDIVCSENFIAPNEFGLTFTLGKDVVGNPICLDLSKMPHLLVAGATGSGKSVFLNCMLVSLMMKYSPEELRFIIVDPKAVEFQAYKSVPHLLFGEIITQDIPLTNATLQWVVDEMNRRYDEFSKLKIKDIKSYNKKCKEEGKKPMFRILVLIDEFADIMVKDKTGVNPKICSIAQMSRAAGIHLVLAAQRPSVDIVEGPIKANLPSRIVFKVTSIHDSKTSLGEVGAEKLLGSGDCLYITDGMSGVERVMGAFISEEDTIKICEHISDTNEKYYDYNAWSKIKRTVESRDNEVQATNSNDVYSNNGGGATQTGNGLDPLWRDAMRYIYQFNKASGSFLQRKLAVGFPRASKIVDQLAEMGILSVLPSNGRLQILLTKEEFIEKFGEL